MEIEDRAMEAAVRATMARESLRVRALRARYFPNDIFAEYAWVLLLHAFLTHVGTLASPAEDILPPFDSQVMRHWRRYLEQQGMVAPGGAPSAPPTLTADGLARMERYLDDLARIADALP